MDNLHMLCDFLYKWQFLTTLLLSPTIDAYQGDFSYTNDTPYLSNVSLLANFPQISTWKYDFDLLQGTFMEKMIQIHQILEKVFLIYKILMISSSRI